MPIDLSTVLIAGPRACFRRPEPQRDLVSYPVIPPLTIRRMLGALDRHHGDLRVVSIAVLRPVRMSLLDATDHAGSGHRTIAALIDVAYLVMLAKAATSGLGSDTHTVHLGLPEFSGTLRVIDPETAKSHLSECEADNDFGLLPYDRLESKARYSYFNAVMRRGVIGVPPPNDPSIFT